MQVLLHSARFHSHPLSRFTHPFLIFFLDDGINYFLETHGEDVGSGCEWSMALHGTFFPDFTGEPQWLRQSGRSGEFEQGTGKARNHGEGAAQCRMQVHGESPLDARFMYDSGIL